MSFLTRLFSGRNAVPERKSADFSSLAAPDDRLLELFGLGPQGQALTGEAALKVPVVAGALRLISEAIAAMPCHIYRRGENGEKDRASDDARHWLLHDRPNPWTTAPEFFEGIVFGALLDGEAFAIATRLDGRVRELIAVPRSAITVETAVAAEPIYRLHTGSGTRVLPRTDVLHLRVAGGRGVVKPARETIGLIAGLSKYVATLAARGGRPSGILEGAATLDDTKRKNLVAALKGADVAALQGKVLMLPDGVKYHQTEFKTTDMQFVEIWRLAILDFCRTTKIPPFMLGELAASTYNNSAEANKAFLQQSLRPIISMLEAVLEMVLIDEDERSKYFIEFLIDDLVRADIKTRLESLVKACGGPFLSPDECRALENRPPIEGGDTLRSPLNTAPAGQETQNNDDRTDV